MRKLVLEAVQAQRIGVDNHLSATLESLIQCILKTVINSPETVAHTTEAVIDNPGFIAPTAALVKLEQQKYMEEKTKIE